MNFMKSVRSLCSPAFLFLVISTIHMIFVITTTFRSDIYPVCVKQGKCEPYYKYLGVSIVYILVATLILNMICSYGYNIIAWLLFIAFIIFRYVESMSADVSISDRYQFK
jgi:hypothetical protein